MLGFSDYTNVNNESLADQMAAFAKMHGGKVTTQDQRKKETGEMLKKRVEDQKNAPKKEPMKASSYKPLGGYDPTSGKSYSEEVETTLGKHRVSVTVSEPDHPSVAQRKEQIQRSVRVTASDEKSAVDRAKNHYKKLGYKVHNVEYHSAIKEEVEQIDELSDKALRHYTQAAHTQMQHYKHWGGKDKPEASSILAKREAGSKVAYAKQNKRRQDLIAAAPKREPQKASSYKPLGGRDEKSGRSYSEQTELGENLVGKQHKLDVDKDGKIEASDFKKLRKEDTLDELSKDTVYSYAKKSEKDLYKKHKELDSQIRANKPSEANKTSSKISNRDKGLDRAENRLNKEDIELQEGAYEKSEENKRSADAAKKQGDMFAHHLHMADHHDNLAQWHGEKGRHGEADKHAEKAEQHHDLAMQNKMNKEQYTTESFTVKDPSGKVVHTAYSEGEAKRKAEALTAQSGKKHTSDYDRTAMVKTNEATKLSYAQFTKALAEAKKDDDGDESENAPQGEKGEERITIRADRKMDSIGRKRPINMKNIVKVHDGDEDGDNSNQRSY